MIRSSPCAPDRPIDLVLCDLRYEQSATVSLALR